MSQPADGARYSLAVHRPHEKQSNDHATPEDERHSLPDGDPIHHEDGEDAGEDRNGNGPCHSDYQPAAISVAISGTAATMQAMTPATRNQRVTS